MIMMNVFIFISSKTSLQILSFQQGMYRFQVVTIFTLLSVIYVYLPQRTI